jgi:hypothetical protein
MDADDRRIIGGDVDIRSALFDGETKQLVESRLFHEIGNPVAPIE